MADNWIRVFDIQDTSKHAKGFTLYKIVSIVYPKSCPDAVTKITVWKRYNDFKKLYRELKLRHKSMHIEEKFPNLPNSSFFKRFDTEIISQRKTSILAFLEYVAVHPSLFKSIEFVKFFETSHTPQEALNSNINIIRAQLNLPNDPEVIFANHSDDDFGASDSDSISTFSMTCTSVLLNDESSILENSSLTNSNPPQNSCTSLSSTRLAPDRLQLVAPSCNVYPTPPTTPEVTTSQEAMDPTQYINTATTHIEKGTALELEQKFEEAFDIYKLGISILLKGVKGDSDKNRRQMIKYQIEKYILRAEKIYHLHLSPEMTQIKNICKNSYDITLYNIKRPIEDLFNFKVLKLIGNGMVVLHRKEHNVFYMKVIQKSLQFSDSLYLNIPKDVPYMVKLFQYYDGPNAVFIVTQYISGGTLLDHIKQKTISTNIETVTKYSSVTFEKEIYDSADRDGEDLSSDSSECSYSDLISDYTNKKNSNSISSISKTERVSNSDTEEGSSITSEYEAKDGAKNIDGLPANSSVASNIVNGIEKDHSNDSISRTLQRSISEKSYTEEFSCINYIPPLYDVVQWAAQLLLAIEKLHKMGIVICDLNPDKLLLDERSNLMLTFVCNFREKGNLFFNKFDNTYYCAPEIFGLGHVTFAADWWSYGSIVFEILTGMSLGSVHPEGIYNYTILKIPKYVSPEGKSLIRQLLIYDPQGRLGCGPNGTEELKSHPFFMAVDWSQLQREALKM